MIYFLKVGEYIKVGYTKNENTFKTRLQTYNTSNPLEVEIINLLEGGVDYERNILNYFTEFHCKGEWFYFNSKIIEFAINPYGIPSSVRKKPLHKNNKVITDNISEIISLYEDGISLRLLSEKFGINRKRLSDSIPEEVKRKKNDWFKINKRETSSLSKRVVCVETGEEFISAAEASRILNINIVSIRKVCRGERNTAGGKTFIYRYNERNRV